MGHRVRGEASRVFYSRSSRSRATMLHVTRNLFYMEECYVTVALLITGQVPIHRCYTRVSLGQHYQTYILYVLPNTYINTDLTNPGAAIILFFFV